MNLWRSLIAHIYSEASITTLAFSFHELGDEASLVAITILQELRLLIQQYFDNVDYVGSLYGQ
jgi:hypothetical protein